MNKYASSSLKNNLESIFSKFNKKTIGENITIVRGELAHVGRPKKLMKVMTIDDYIKIGLYLKVTITSHLLSKLGLTKEQIERYQSKVAP
ncbi:HEPN domain-containing protein [Serratia nevei]|uniref:HEPN domain-containing protein n=1 Tax=Serratia nevei TaxID=2703794 RepID=UPI00313DC6E1